MMISLTEADTKLIIHALNSYKTRIPENHKGTHERIKRLLTRLENNSFW